MQRFHSFIHTVPWLRLAAAITAGLLLAGSAAAQGPGPIREDYAELPGVRLFYRDTGGSGVPVVFMHANTGSSLFWEKQIPAFTAAGYRMIMYDRRGIGRSTLDPSSGPQPGTAADDLLRLADHLGLERFHIVASAAGGSITWDFLLAYPDRVRSVVIANNTGRLTEPDYRGLVESLRPRQWDELPADFRELGPVYRAADPDGVERWRELHHQAQEDRADIRQPLKEPLTFARIGTVRTPVLLIAGGADLAAPAPLLRFFTDANPRIKTFSVPDAGHSTFWEQPGTFNRAVLEFIDRY